jgi:phospholipase/carboxylesterase
VPPLLHSLEALGFIARYLNPPDFDRVMGAVGQPDEALRAVRPRLEQWPRNFAHIKAPLEAASDAALARSRPAVVQDGHGDFVKPVSRPSHAPRAQEALYA